MVGLDQNKAKIRIKCRHLRSQRDCWLSTTMHRTPAPKGEIGNKFVIPFKFDFLPALALADYFPYLSLETGRFGLPAKSPRLHPFHYFPLPFTSSKTNMRSS